MKRIAFLVIALFAIVGCSTGNPVRPGETGEVREVHVDEARAALDKLYRQAPGARQLANGAAAILIFPEITKAGFVVGGQYGTGILFRDDGTVGRYRSSAASYGLQAGIQKFGYAMFFMSESDLAYLNKSNGWEVGVGPSVTVVDQGFANSLTTTTARKGVYVFFFEQRGLMAGLGIQGTKITKIL